MKTARKHFGSKGTAGGFAALKKTQGFNVGAVRLPIRGQREWIIFWSPGFLNPGRSRRA
jgi:hypothetical protein